MDTTGLKNKKLWLVVTAVLVLLIGALGAPKAWYAVQDLTFYWTERTETELKVKAFAEENGLFFAQYPESLIELLEGNPETEEFVLRYPLRQSAETDLSGFDFPFPDPIQDQLRAVSARQQVPDLFGGRLDITDGNIMVDMVYDGGQVAGHIRFRIPFPRE